MINKNEQPKSKIPIFIMTFCTTLTSFFIQAFLSGKIIDIPHGTPARGVIAATGVAIILVSMIILTFLIRLLINLKKIN
jgi:hypothetical protein